MSVLNVERTTPSYKEGWLTTVFMLALCFSSPQIWAEDINFITLGAAPWASENENTGDIEGVFPLLMDELESRLGHEITIALTPFARIHRELASGRQDCTILVSTPELAAITEQGAFISHHAIGVIARRGIILNEYEDIIPLTISVLRGTKVSPKFDNDKRLKKEFDTNYVIGLRKLSHKRLDAIFGAIPTIRYLAEQEGLSDQLGGHFVLEDVPLLLQCSKKSSKLHLMRELNQTILDMHTDGTITAIKEKYYF